jgi:hypothetical protein
MEESLETRNGKRLDTGPSSNPEWLQSNVMFWHSK